MPRRIMRYFQLYHHESCLRMALGERCKVDFMYYRAVCSSCSSNFNNSLHVFSLK